MPRILIVDDNQEILNDYQKILRPTQNHKKDLHKLAADLFEEYPSSDLAPKRAQKEFALTIASNGLDAVERVTEAIGQFSLAFIDIRMPPGIDGIETSKRIWALDPNIQIVLCTAYSDYSLEEIVDKLIDSDKLLILKKPFDRIEVTQIANALSNKWEIQKQLRKHRNTQDRHFRQQKKYAEDLSRTIEDRNSFFARISHDLRTPLNGILGVMDLLNCTEITDEQAEFLSIITRSGKTLLRLVNDVLDYTQLDSCRLEIIDSLIDINHILDTSIKLFEHDANKKGIKLKGNVNKKIPNQLVGDGTRIEQVLCNIIGNAMKFTKVGQISTSIEGTKKSATVWDVSITVSDTGPGIPEEKLKAIFKSFHQIDPAHPSNNGGVGLGLAISQGLVELMGGTINAFNGENGGAVFKVTIPLETVVPENQAYSHHSDGLSEIQETIKSGSFKPVLIVDNTEQNRFTLRRQLSFFGLGVIEASTPQEALEICENGEVCMAFINSEAPTIHQLSRINASNKRIPIIALVSKNRCPDKKDELDSEYDSCISNPCSLNILKNHLSEYLLKQMKLS